MDANKAVLGNSFSELRDLENETFSLLDSLGVTGKKKKKAGGASGTGANARSAAKTNAASHADMTAKKRKKISSSSQSIPNAYDSQNHQSHQQHRASTSESTRSSHSLSRSGTGSLNTTMMSQTMPMHSQSLNNLSLNLSQTQGWYTDNRMTVEVFDDASPDDSPRDVIDARTNRMKLIAEEIGGLTDIQKAEQKIRQMTFTDEKSRVVTAADTFVPAPTVTKEDILFERQRLTKLEESARDLKQKYEKETMKRREFYGRDKAAVRIQKVFRGHVGRQKYSLSKRLHDLNDAGDWVEVRDRQTGDGWFYNKRTGASQWERPGEMRGKISSSKSLRKLPQITNADYPSLAGTDTRMQTAGTAPGTAITSLFSSSGKRLGATDGLPTLTDPRVSTAGSMPRTAPIYGAATTLTGYDDVLADEAEEDADNYPMEEHDDDAQLIEAEARAKAAAEAVEERKASQEIDEILGFDKLTPAERLLIPDGSFKPQLRATVLDALRDTRFDNISSLVADTRWLESEFDQGATLGAKRGKRGGAKTALTPVDNTRRPFVSVLKLRKGEYKMGDVGDRKPGTANTVGTRPATTTSASGKSNADRPSTTNSNSKTIEDFTLRDMPHPGLGLGDSSAVPKEGAQEEAPMCFGCWSAGLSKRCALHEEKNAPVMKKSQTLLLCRNWDLGVIRRRYRSEEIQELFGKKSNSLRYDSRRKVFSTVVELKHPIYRYQSNLLNWFNSNLFLKLKVRRWLITFAEQVRRDEEFNKPGDAEKNMYLRNKRNVENHRQVMKYTNKARDDLPRAPTTGYSYAEIQGYEQYLFRHHDTALAAEVDLIVAPPTPPITHLFLTRECDLPVPRSIPMPRPQYKEGDAESIFPMNNFINELNPAAWLERYVTAMVRDCVWNAQDQIEVLTPVAGLELLRRSKQPPPCSIKFATLGRKPTPGNLDVAALPMELLINQLISTFVPPQYGDFMVMEKTIISPGISAEMNITFETLAIQPNKQPYVSRPIEHPLNYRRAPSITVNSKVRQDDKHLYGLNRPDQTGEEESHGFRTTTWSVRMHVDVDTDPMSFIPNADVVTLNKPAANQAHSTHADLSYPFCQPSTRDNTTLDFYHLMLSCTFSFPKSQVFTVLTIQEPGKFMRESNQDYPMGRLVANVYRSWAFQQRDPIQEFKTDDGYPYWYNRENGQTYWERPLASEETVNTLKGGVVIDNGHDEMPTTAQAGDTGLGPHYNQGEFRKLMKNHHETEKEAEGRRHRVSRNIDTSKFDGTLPAVPDDFEMSAITGDEEDSPQHGQSTRGRVESGDSAAGSEFASPGRGVSPRIGTGNSVMRSRKGSNMSTASGMSTRNQSAMPGKRSALTTPRGNEMQSPASPSRKTSGQVGGGGTRSQSPLGDSGSQLMVPGVDPNVMANFSQTLSQMMTSVMSANTTPQDMIQLGMGMGLALLQSGVAQSVAHQGNMSPTHGQGVPGSARGDGRSPMSARSDRPGGNMVANTASMEKSFFPQVVDGVEINKDSSLLSARQMYGSTREPIGQSKATESFSVSKPLDHSEQTMQQQTYASLNDRQLTALERAQEMRIAQAGYTPDDIPLKDFFETKPLNADEKARNKVPVLVYPELSGVSQRGVPHESITHPAGGIGTSWLKESASKFVEGTDTLKRIVMPLPVGFFQAIVEKKVAKAEVEYLPKVPNLPHARTVGRVTPRSAALDWLAVSFDPWSAGKKPLNKEYISNLASVSTRIFNKGADNVTVMESLRKQSQADSAVVNVMDEEGLNEQRAEIAKNQLIAEEFRKLCSLCRHSKFTDAEDMLTRPDWNVPIDYQDELGNALLHIVCQNGNKRMVRLCLRRDANINMQNLNGQTPLHFAFGYGYSDVGEYLLSKGADDTILNKDKLTCYEGLGARELQYL